ncbi:MAG: DUF3524 domain-containing protein [Planctomycetaceae bacterium]
MRVLALNPFHGGSHRAFIEGWIQHSRHEFTLLTLPDRHWKWRMRQAAVHFAQQLSQVPYVDQRWDTLWVTDMLNLAEFRGLCRDDVRQLPSVMYCHENQLTYPTRGDEGDLERDLHFGVTNVISALAADEVWWNSRFHRDEFLTALSEMSRLLPDRTLTLAADEIRKKSNIFPPGIEGFPPRWTATHDSPPHILWAARWEHDKQPELLFAALERLDHEGIAFEISVIGQSYREMPVCFHEARERFADRIRNWGYLDSRETYRDVLQSADIYVSTAAHEFFGIAAVEAIAAGCYPLLPRRLSYPELVNNQPDFLYAGDSASLSQRLTELITTREQERNFSEAAEPARLAVERFLWKNLVPLMDDQLEAFCKGTK